MGFAARQIGFRVGHQAALRFEPGAPPLVVARIGRLLGLGIAVRRRPVSGRDGPRLLLVLAPAAKQKCEEAAQATPELLRLFDRSRFPAARQNLRARLLVARRSSLPLLGICTVLPSGNSSASWW